MDLMELGWNRRDKKAHDSEREREERAGKQWRRLGLVGLRGREDEVGLFSASRVVSVLFTSTPIGVSAVKLSATSKLTMESVSEELDSISSIFSSVAWAILILYFNARYYHRSLPGLSFLSRTKHS
jgi:hypothetical protein